MLIALLTAYLLMHFGSHSSALSAPFEQAETLIKKNVSDTARQKEALAIVDRMKTQAEAYTEKRKSMTDVLDKLLTNRKTPETEVEHAGQPLIDEDRVCAEKLLDLRFQLKAVLTASEWAKVFPAGYVSEKTTYAPGGRLLWTARGFGPIALPNLQRPNDPVPALDSAEKTARERWRRLDVQQASAVSSDG